MPRPTRSPRRCSRSGRRRHVPRVHGIRAPGGVGSSTRPRARAHDRRPRNSRIGRLLTTRRVGLPTAAAGRTTNGRSAYCYRAGRPSGPGVDAAAQPPARPSCGGAPGPAHDVLAVGENRTLWRLDVAVPQVCCRRTRRARITRSEQRHAQHASQPARWGPSTAPDTHGPAMARLLGRRTQCGRSGCSRVPPKGSNGDALPRGQSSVPRSAAWHSCCAQHRGHVAHSLSMTG